MRDTQWRVSWMRFTPRSVQALAFSLRLRQTFDVRIRAAPLGAREHSRRGPSSPCRAELCCATSSVDAILVDGGTARDADPATLLYSDPRSYRRPTQHRNLDSARVRALSFHKRYSVALLRAARRRLVANP